MGSLDELGVFSNTFAEISQEYISKLTQNNLYNDLKSITDEAGIDLFVQEGIFSVKGAWKALAQVQASFINLLNSDVFSIDEQDCDGNEQTNVTDHTDLVEEKIDDITIRVNAESECIEDDVLQYLTTFSDSPITRAQRVPSDTPIVPNPLIIYPSLQQASNFKMSSIIPDDSRKKSIQILGKLYKSQIEKRVKVGGKDMPNETDFDYQDLLCNTSPVVTVQGDNYRLQNTIVKQEDSPCLNVITTENNDETVRTNSINNEHLHRNVLVENENVNEKRHGMQTRYSGIKKEPLVSDITEKRRNKKYLGKNVTYPSETSDSNNSKRRGRPRKISNINSTKYSCKTCSYFTHKKHLLQEHKKQCQTKPPLKCDVCNKEFDVRKDLNRHKQIHSRPENCCDICGKLYKGYKNLVQHKLTHDSTYIKPVFTCDICNRSFTTKYVLAQHIKSQHLGLKKTYICPTCNKCFSQKHSYIQHAKVHIGYKPYKCEICGKSFSYEKSLKEHRYTHEDIKRFPCNVCGKYFRQSSALTIHLRIHKDTKGYVCTTCGKVFSQKQALVRHERIHVGEKPFLCQLCSRPFSDSSILRRHMILIHKKSPKNWTENTARSTMGKTNFYVNVNNGDTSGNTDSVTEHFDERLHEAAVLTVVETDFPVDSGQISDSTLYKESDDQFVKEHDSVSSEILLDSKTPDISQDQEHNVGMKFTSRDNTQMFEVINYPYPDMLLLHEVPDSCVYSSAGDHSEFSTSQQ